MKIQIVKIGKAAFSEVKALVTMYETRLAAFARVEHIEVKDPSALEKSTRKNMQALSCLKDAGTSAHVLITLDERGQQWRSSELADRIQKLSADSHVKTLTFLIGGPYGLPPAIREKSNYIWSLSLATLPSDLAWLLCWEQVYRAFNLIKGTSYHHE